MADNYALFYNSKKGDRIYDADSMTNWLRPFFVTGVFNGELQVTANDDMTVTVAGGYCNIGGKVKNFIAPTKIDLETASGTLDRIDTVILRRNDTDRDIQVIVKTGGYSSNPQPTPLVREGAYYDLKLAEIYVAAGSIRITQAEITDTRADKDVCGWVCSTVKEIDLTQITAQFSSYFAQYQEKITTEFKTYVAYMKNLEAQFDTFQADLMKEETRLHEKHEKDIEDYLLQMQERGNSNLTELTQQLIDFRNTKEAEFLGWFETIKGVFSTDAAGELLLKINDLAEQVEFNRMMITSGKTLTRIGTSQGDYLIDSTGNPILAGWSICKCQT